MVAPAASQSSILRLHRHQTSSDLPTPCPLAGFDLATPNTLNILQIATPCPLSGFDHLIAPNTLTISKPPKPFLPAGFDHLIVATSTQCHIYSTSNWNTPHIFDLKDTVTLILQCERHFLVLDNASGLQLYTYEGRQICNPKFQGGSSASLSTPPPTSTCSLHSDVSGVRDVLAVPTAGHHCSLTDWF